MNKILASALRGPAMTWHPINRHLSLSGQWHQMAAQDPATFKALIILAVIIAIVGIGGSLKFLGRSRN